MQTIWFLTVRPQFSLELIPAGLPEAPFTTHAASNVALCPGDEFDTNQGGEGISWGELVGEKLLKPHNGFMTIGGESSNMGFNG